VPYLSASAVVIHYEEALSSVCIFTFTVSSLVDRFLWKAAPDHLQRFSEFGDCLLSPLCKLV